MMSMTNMKSVLDDMFEKKESELYSNIASADVDQKLALVDFFVICERFNCKEVWCISQIVQECWWKIQARKTVFHQISKHQEER